MPATRHALAWHIDVTMYDHPNQGCEKVCGPCSETTPHGNLRGAKGCWPQAYNTPTRSYININIRVIPCTLRSLTQHIPSAIGTMQKTKLALLAIVRCRSHADPRSARIGKNCRIMHAAVRHRSIHTTFQSHRLPMLASPPDRLHAAILQAVVKVSRLLVRHESPTWRVR